MRALPFFSLILLISGVFSIPAAADGFIIINEPLDHEITRRHPHPHPPRPPRPIHRYMPLEVKEHHVKVEINGSVATTSVDQTFFNPSGQRLEGTYMFPIPVGAEIDKFEMDVNGEMTEAELLDAKKARSIYEEIVRKAKDPALMEYASQGMFKVRIFPIEPRSDKRIKIKYTQILKRDGRITEYVYPLNTEKFSSAPIQSVSIKTTIESQRELKSIYSPSHEIEVSRKNKHRAVIGFEESGTRPDTDFQLFFTSDDKDGEPIGLELLSYRAKTDDDGYYMMLLSPGAWENEKTVPKDVVFAVDTSGSMRAEKIEQAKRALQFCIDSLGENDRFEIVRYSTEAEALFEGIVPANKKNRSQAQEFIDGLKAGGGTAIEEALLKSVGYATEGKKADAARPFQVIFLTDGRPTIGETRPDKILERLQTETDGAKSVRVFSFGIGTDINTKLLDRIAQDTQALTEYVLPEEDIEHKVSHFYSKIAQPVMADLKIKASGGVRLSKRHPGALPDLFKGDQMVVLGRYSPKKKGEGKPMITLTGSLAGEKVSFEYPAKFIKKSTTREFIPRLWATRRVGYLLDEIRLRGKNKELEDEVVKLARRWGIVTPYTSYLIIEDEETRGVPVARQSMGRRRGLPMPSSAPAEDGAAGAGDGLRPDSRAKLAELERSQRGGEKAAFDAFSDSETGNQAVAGARASSELKRATATGASKKAYKQSQYGAAVRFAAQETRIVAGKTFYCNGTVWIDSEVPEKPETAPKKIEFASEDYFALLGKDGAIPQWLSVGDHLQVLIDGSLYEIVPAKS